MNWISMWSETATREHPKLYRPTFEYTRDFCSGVKLLSREFPFWRTRSTFAEGLNIFWTKSGPGRSRQREPIEIYVHIESCGGLGPGHGILCFMVYLFAKDAFTPECSVGELLLVEKYDWDFHGWKFVLPFIAMGRVRCLTFSTFKYVK